jgi:hypothetical protein
MRGFLSISNKLKLFLICSFYFAYSGLIAQAFKPYYHEQARLYYYSKDGSIDSTHQLFDYAEPFNNGVALVRYQQRWQYLDSNLNLLYAVFYAEATNFTNGFATVFLDNGQCQVVNKQRQYLFPAAVDQVRTMQNGFLAFSQMGKWGFISDSAKVILPPTYDAVSDLVAGNFWAKQNGFWTLRSLTSNLVLSDQYDRISSINNGEVLAINQQLMFRIDMKANKIIEQWPLPAACQYKSISGLFLVNGLSIIQIGSNEFLAFKNGQLLWRIQATQLKTDGLNQLAFKIQERFVLYDLNLKQLSQMTYEDLDFYPKKWMKIYLGTHYYFKTPSENLIR